MGTHYEPVGGSAVDAGPADAGAGLQPRGGAVGVGTEGCGGAAAEAGAVTGSARRDGSGGQDVEALGGLTAMVILMHAGAERAGGHMWRVDWLNLEFDGRRAARTGAEALLRLVRDMGRAEGRNEIVAGFHRLMARPVAGTCPVAL